LRGAVVVVFEILVCQQQLLFKRLLMTAHNPSSFFFMASLDKQCLRASSGLIRILSLFDGVRVVVAFLRGALTTTEPS